MELATLIPSYITPSTAAMTSERDLNRLLADVQPVLDPEIYVFCTLAPDTALPAGINPLAIFREREGCTLILPRAEAEAAALSCQFTCRMITLNVHSALDAIGFLAAVAGLLATAEISVNAVSAYYHDHLFVPVERTDDAMRLLGEGFGAPGR
jgi:hypothetical protein